MVQSAIPRWRLVGPHSNSSRALICTYMDCFGQGAQGYVSPQAEGGALFHAISGGLSNRVNALLQPCDLRRVCALVEVGVGRAGSSDYFRHEAGKSYLRRVCLNVAF
jgi:hypothetical protein